MTDELTRLITDGAPDPRDALLRCERIMDALAEVGLALAELAPPAREVLRLCCQRAPYLATLLTRDPYRLKRVAASAFLRREKLAETMVRELGEALAGCASDDVDELSRILRHYRADELVRLGVRELELGNPRVVGRELAHLADACFDVAIEFHDRMLRARYGPPRYRDHDGHERDAGLVVMAMGKLGGEELNFSSDVDVIYIYSSDAGSAGALSLHEYFAKLCKRVTASLAEVTAEDMVFRVDLRLRPEGSQGPIANSLPSAERYYETFGRPWERQVWLKARPCAGDLALGAEVMATLRPFVYPRSISVSVIDEVNSLNQRIKAELDSGAPGYEVKRGFDLKNGVGGIREIEFFVQALQLIHAGRQPGLRTASTLSALDQLLFAGLVTEHEHRTLVDAYGFLRRAEHLLQLDCGRQTQRLPADPGALEVYARRLGLAGREALAAALAKITAAVNQLFQSLGGAEAGPPHQVMGLLSARSSPEDERRFLAELGFRAPEDAWRALVRARRAPLSPFGSVAPGASGRVAAELLADIAASPDPDLALEHTTDLIAHQSGGSWMWRLFEQYPALRRLVTSLFGTSAFLSKYVTRHPALVLDMLIEIGRSHCKRTRAQLIARLDAALDELDDDDEENLWSRLAGFKHAEVLRIGLADIGGELDAEEVSAELSKLAEVCLERALTLVQHRMEARHGVPRAADGGERGGGGDEVTLAVLALGKLGGRELGYASDLDVVFVYSGEGRSDGPRPLDNVLYMTRLAQRLMSGLHSMHPGGRLYEVDTRLRPSGSQGLLVSTLRAWEQYHRDEAALWERQALIKLRPVAGDAALGARVAQAAAKYVYGHAPGERGRESVAEIAAGITSMRDRIERERAGGRTAQDIKVGRGGLVDIEFASQYLQLVHGHAVPEMRTVSTVEALTIAAERGLAAEADCALLAHAYRFLRTIEHRLRIVHDRSVQRLPEEPGELDKLARRTGYDSGEALLDDFVRYTEEVRAVYGRVLA
ncbi:MAG: bifunctional [glutamate--ammonia ligase]-adenylyl-L-tyrosine phosphorylase/[glutamate--ammonia-ligase] adenylyltransferase [Haliangiales bacterium]